MDPYNQEPTTMVERIVSRLPENQRGPGRHKDPHQAFVWGLWGGVVCAAVGAGVAWYVNRKRSKSHE